MKERFYSKKCNSTAEVKWTFAIAGSLIVFWLSVLAVVVMGGVR